MLDMVGGVLKFVIGGRALKTSMLIWAKNQTDYRWNAETIIKDILLAIVTGLTGKHRIATNVTITTLKQAVQKRR